MGIKLSSVPDITNVGWVMRCSQGRLWNAENAVTCSV